MNNSKKEVASMYERVNAVALCLDIDLHENIYKFEDVYFKDEKSIEKLYNYYGDMMLRAFRNFKEDMASRGISLENADEIFGKHLNNQWNKAKSYIEFDAYSKFIFVEVVGEAIMKGNANKITIDHSKAVDPSERQANLIQSEDIMAMIDLALDTNDKKWFDELVAMLAIV